MPAGSHIHRMKCRRTKAPETRRIALIVPHVTPLWSWKERPKMGRVFRPKYAWTNAKGERIKRYTKEWYIQYYANGRCVRRKAGVTKEQAQDALRKAEM